jgi:serine protease Do
VRQVEPGGPAEAAGLRAGDRLIEIDGVAMTSPDGGRRFTAIKPGKAVQWTIERGGARQMVRIVAQERKTGPGAERAERLRYSGTLGEARIEVRGAPVNVTEDSRSGEVVIRSHDLLVKVKVPRQDGGGRR